MRGRDDIVSAFEPVRPAWYSQWGNLWLVAMIDMRI